MTIQGTHFTKQPLLQPQPCKGLNSKTTAIQVIGEQILCADTSGNIERRDLSSWKQIGQHPFHEDKSPITSFVYTGKAIYETKISGPITKWINNESHELNLGEGKKRVVGQNSCTVFFHRISYEESNHEGSHYLYTLENDEKMHSYQLPTAMTAFYFCEDDHWFVGDEQGTIYQFKKNSDTELKSLTSFSAHEGPVYALKMHEGYLYSSGKDELHVWDNDFQCISTIHTNGPAIDFDFFQSDQEWKICALLSPYSYLVLTQYDRVEINGGTPTILDFKQRLSRSDSVRRLGQQVRSKWNKVSDGLSQRVASSKHAQHLVGVRKFQA